MPTSKSVDEVVDAIGHMSREERDELILRMARMDGMLEELEDVAEVLRRSHESTRPYEEFLDELRAEGRDV